MNMASRGRWTFNVEVNSVPNACEVEASGARLLNGSCADLLGYCTDLRVREAQSAALRTWGAVLEANCIVLKHFEDSLAEAFGRASAQLLAAAPKRSFIQSGTERPVVDAIDPLTGSLEPLRRLVSAHHERNDQVQLQDRLGFGVLGPKGLGVADHLGVGSHFALHAVAVTPSLAGSFWCVLSDAPTPANGQFSSAQVAGAGLAFALSRKEPERRHRLMQLASRLQAGLRSLDLDIGPTVTPFTPVWFGEESLALRWMDAMGQAGIAVKAWLHPTQSRLMLSPCAVMQEQQIDRILDVVSQLQKRIGAPLASVKPSSSLAVPGSFAYAGEADAHWHADGPEPMPNEVVGFRTTLLDLVETWTWRASNFRSPRLRQLVDVRWITEALDRGRRHE